MELGITFTDGFTGPAIPLFLSSLQIFTNQPQISVQMSTTGKRTSATTNEDPSTNNEHVPPAKKTKPNEGDVEESKQKEKQQEKLTFQSTITLNDGIEIPIVGLGTYERDRLFRYIDILKGEKVDSEGAKKHKEEEEGFKNAVVKAIECGYRHIDTAQVSHTVPRTPYTIQKIVPSTHTHSVTPFFSGRHTKIDL